VKSYKQKGDLDSVLVLMAEQKRFDTERTVPLPTNTVATYGPAVESYHKATAELMKKYMVALDGLIRQLMIEDKISEAKEAKEEKETAIALLVNSETKVLKTEKIQPFVEKTSQIEPPAEEPNETQPTQSKPRLEPIKPVIESKNDDASQNGFRLSGIQKQDVVELIAGKTYMIEGSYVLRNGQQLLIQQGVTIVFDKGAFLEVNGTLVVNGTAVAPVTFKGRFKTPGSWNGISGNPETCIISFAIVRDAKCGIAVSKGNIENCLLTENETGSYGQNCAYSNCVAERNKGVGITVDFGRSTIASTTITKNGGVGLDGGPNGSFAATHCIVTFNMGGGVSDFRHNSTINDSIITDNTGVDASSTESTQMDCTKNWWGTRYTDLLNKKGDGVNLPNIYDKHDGGRSLVIVSDWLTKRPTDCGATLQIGPRRFSDTK